MRRYSQNNDNRHYAYLPPTNTISSRNSSSNSLTRNTHYHYYDPRLRSQQQTQQALYEYTYANRSPDRNQPALYNLARTQQPFQQPPFLQESRSTATSVASDLGEPISVFDDITPLEYQRPIITPTLSSLYVPPGPSRRPSLSDVRLATSHVLREQLVTDIERSINDIDRELTSLERRPSMPRYLPPRFSPIVEFESQDENQLPLTPTSIKPMTSLPTRKPIPAITSPGHKQSQQTSAHSTIPERHSGNTQVWPNKPKRAYKVIPSLTGDSRKTSRQSSVGGQSEHIKISEIQSPQSPPKTIEKYGSLSSIQVRAQYHYGPEAEEIEILSNDLENIDHKSLPDETEETIPLEILNTEQFLRDSSASPKNWALNFVPEYSGNSQLGEHETTEDLIENTKPDTDNAQALIANSTHALIPNKELVIQDIKSLIQTAPEIETAPEIQVAPLFAPRIHSRSTATPQELYHTTETDLRNQKNELISDDIKQSPTTPTSNDDVQEKISSLPNATNDDTTTIVPLPSSSSPPPPAPSSTSTAPPAADNNVSGLVAYFFSDFGNEGESEEDILSIDQSNFVVPTGAEIIADDDLRNSLMGQSQASLLILHSAHVPRQQQQQQHLTSIMPSTIENNNEYIATEGKEEIGSIENDTTKKRISITTPVLPSSSSSSPPPLRPSSNQTQPISTIDDMQTQFIRNNSTINNEHYRETSTTPSNMNKIDLNTEEPEEYPNNNNASYRLHSLPPSRSQTHSPAQSTTSEKRHEQNKDETRTRSSANNTPLENLDNRSIQSPHDRIPSTVQRSKSSAKTLSRRSSQVSNRTKKDEETTPTASPTKTVEQENVPTRRSVSQQRSRTPSAQYNASRQNSAFGRRQSTNHEIDPAYNVFRHDQLNNSQDNDDDDDDDDDNNYIRQTPTNANEPNTFSAESEHFLHHKSETSPYNRNQRISSGYSISHPNDSRRSSTISQTLPVTLDSPDIDMNQPKTSRTATPTRKNSISSINAPPDPNTLLTTTDEPDPDDPSKMNSTIHFRMLSSQQPTNQISTTEHREPSPLVNIVPREKVPSRMNSIESPNEEQLHYNPIGRNEPQSPPNNSRSSSRSDEHDEVLRHSPVLSYPARLEDLMRPTPSPFLSTHEEQQQQQRQVQHEIEQKSNNHIPSVSPTVNQTNEHPHHHQSVNQNLSSQFKSNNNHHSPSSSPRRSPSPNLNRTAADNDNIYRQQIDSPPYAVPQNDRVISRHHNDHNHNGISKQNLLPPIEQTLNNKKQRRPSSERSISSEGSHREHEMNLYRNDPPINSASIHGGKQHFSPRSSPFQQPSSDENEIPSITPSQQHSKLSLRVKKQKSKRKKSINSQQQQQAASSPLPQNDTIDMIPTNNDENFVERKPKEQQPRRRKVSFSSSIEHFQIEDRQMLTNWRERVAAILARKHGPHEKYAYVQSRVNSFANFEHQPKKIMTPPKRKPRPKPKEGSTNLEESRFIKRKKFKVKKPKVRQETDTEEHTDNDQQQQPPRSQSVKASAPQLFGRLWCLPDGSPTVFHESLAWNASSKLKTYSYENFNHEPQRHDFKIFNKKPKWNSESKLSELLKDSPRSFHRQTLIPAISLPILTEAREPYYSSSSYLQPSSYQQRQQQQLGIERKIFDIQTNAQQPQPSETIIQNDNRSHASKSSEIPVFNEKLIWAGRSKLKNTTWKNINYQPKKSNVQIFHKSVHWNSEPRIRIRSPSTVGRPSRTSMSNVQIFDQRLNWDAQAKVHCWSEIDLRQLTRKRSIFAQYHDPKWSDVVTARVDATNYHYPRMSNHVEIFSDRLVWTRESGLKDYVWENFDYKLHPKTRQANTRRNLQTTEQESEKMAFDLRLSTVYLSQFRRAASPANKPKWNAVSKTRSVNTIYNPKVPNTNTVRRGWDRDLRRKRVHKLPPLKRKKDREKVPQLTIDNSSSNEHLAIDYNYEQSSTVQDQTTSNGYGTLSSRRSSKALGPLNQSRRFSELELPNETPRSNRPVQQEWYDEMTKSRLTHRTDMGRATNHSFRNSVDSNHQANTPRELATFRSSTQNSQNSVMSGTLLDSSVRTNRATEFRLSKDMNEHHQHSHSPNQSMPFEIRGFQLEGRQLSVPDHATIRPLSNVNYGTSERVKTRRIYPWSNLHPHGTSSRNSSLVPIAEFRRQSLNTTINENQQLIHEE